MSPPKSGSRVLGYNLKLISTLHNDSIPETPSGKSGVDVSTPVHPVATGNAPRGRDLDTDGLLLIVNEDRSVDVFVFVYHTLRRSVHITHLTSSDFISADLISSEPSALWLVAAAGSTTQFAVAAASHNAPIS